MVIKESILNRSIDNVENLLETFFLEYKSKSKNWVGMESLLNTQYIMRLDAVLQSKAYTALNQLETKHRFIVSNRLKDFLALAKDEYDRN